MRNKHKAKYIVLSGPSAVGKDSVAALLSDLLPNAVLSVSSTTRKPRQKTDGTMEQDGIDYIFLERSKFLSQHYLEKTEYLGELYGTSIECIQQLEHAGFCYIILNLDDIGVIQLKQLMPDATSVLLLPPSAKELRHRLVSRQSETEAQITERMQKSCNQLKNMRLEYYDHVIINDDLRTTAQQITERLTNTGYNQNFDDKQALVDFVYSTFTELN